MTMRAWPSSEPTCVPVGRIVYCSENRLYGGCPRRCSRAAVSHLCSPFVSGWFWNLSEPPKLNRAESNRHESVVFSTRTESNGSFRRSEPNRLGLDFRTGPNLHPEPNRIGANRTEPLPGRVHCVAMPVDPPVGPPDPPIGPPGPPGRGPDMPKTSYGRYKHRIDTCPQTKCTCTL